MLLLILVNAAPLILLGFILWRYRMERPDLIAWRRNIFVCALIANAVSASVLLAFVFRALFNSRPTDLDRMFPVFSMFLLGLLAAALAVAGRRSSRILLSCNGVLTVILWYMAALAASP
jgi:hypothetical protein